MALPESTFQALAPLQDEYRALVGPASALSELTGASPPGIFGPVFSDIYTNKLISFERRLKDLDNNKENMTSESMLYQKAVLKYEKADFLRRAYPCNFHSLLQKINRNLDSQLKILKTARDQSILGQCPLLVLRCSGGIYYVDNASAYPSYVARFGLENFSLVAVESVRPSGSIDDWINLEVIHQMHNHGVNRVKGGRYTDAVLSPPDYDDAFSQICQVFNLCTFCGSPSHSADICAEATRPGWAKRTLHHSSAS